MAPSLSRRLSRGLPMRKAARATRAVSSGTGWIGAGLRDMADLRQKGTASLNLLLSLQSGDFANGIRSLLAKTGKCLRPLLRASSRRFGVLAWSDDGSVMASEAEAGLSACGST